MPKEKLPDLTMPVNDDCNNCGDPIKPTDSWGRDETKLRVHFPRCMSKREPDAYDLDAKWAELAKEGDPFIAGIEAAYQTKVAECEAMLKTLREYAARKLASDD